MAMNLLGSLSFPSSTLAHTSRPEARFSSSKPGRVAISTTLRASFQKPAGFQHAEGFIRRRTRARECCLAVSLKDEVTESSSSSSSQQELSTKFPVAQIDDTDLVEDADFNGKAGFVSFYTGPKGEDRLLTGAKHRSLLWLLGPFLLVAAVVFPPYVFRVVFEYLLYDTVVTDFIILFFTEAYFYIGVTGFLYVAHMFRGPVRSPEPEPSDESPSPYTWGYTISATLCTALSATIAASTLVLTWKYTGPAAIAALVPYLFGLGIQFIGENFASDKPAVRPLLPVVFQVYRLHQLNRAAQLVAGLIFSMKTAEASAQTVTITGSLQTILSSLQVLGILALWSLGAFLMQTTAAWHHGKGVSLVPL